MAKQQSFGDKVRKSKAEAKKMAKVVLAVKKPNGHYAFKQQIVNIDDVQDVLKAAKTS